MGEEIEGESELTPSVFFRLPCIRSTGFPASKTALAGPHLKVSDSVRSGEVPRNLQFSRVPR